MERGAVTNVYPALDSEGKDTIQNPYEITGNRFVTNFVD